MKKTLSSLAVISLMATPVLAMAASDSALIKGGALNLRQEASTDAKVLGQYATGTLVELVSSVNDSWTKVNVNGKAGYMMKKYLNEGKGDTTLLVRTNTKGLNMREAPHTAGAIITSYPKDTKIKVLQKGINWSRVLMDGKEGFMSAQYLSASASSGGSASYVQPKFKELETPYTAKLININGTGIVNFRDGGSLNAKIIRTYKVGTEVKVTALSTDWARVEIEGEVGYVSIHFMKK